MYRFTKRNLHFYQIQGKAEKRYSYPIPKIFAIFLYLISLALTLYHIIMNISSFLHYLGNGYSLVIEIRFFP